MYTESNKSVLLQTAKAMAFNPCDKDRRMEVQVVLDSGSQRSYITERARRALALRSQGRKTMSIATFGAKEVWKQLCDTVVVGVCTRDGLGKELSLLSVPLICEPLSISPIHHCILEYPHLTSLDLACPSRDMAQKGPDILIGCDFYWDIVTGETVRGDRGPTAVQTKLGWVLSGPISINESHSSASLVTHILRVLQCT